MSSVPGAPILPGHDRYGPGRGRAFISIQRNLHTQSAPRGGAAHTAKFGPPFRGTAGPVQGRALIAAGTMG